MSVISPTSPTIPIPLILPIWPYDPIWVIPLMYRTLPKSPVHAKHPKNGECGVYAIRGDPPLHYRQQP